jgi:hypothetical protein
MKYLILLALLALIASCMAECPLLDCAERCENGEELPSCCRLNQWRRWRNRDMDDYRGKGWMKHWGKYGKGGPKDFHHFKHGPKGPKGYHHFKHGPTKGYHHFKHGPTKGYHHMKSGKAIYVKVGPKDVREKEVVDKGIKPKAKSGKGAPKLRGAGLRDKKPDSRRLTEEEEMSMDSEMSVEDEMSMEMEDDMSMGMEDEEMVCIVFCSVCE